ncbi:MAG: nucleoside triphosphate pyrophosphohydrolase [candidate division WOR-3 bacterium]
MGRIRNQKLKISDAFHKLFQLVKTLRRKCPWDRRQTLATIKNNVIEEAYEVLAAIEKQDRTALKEEIGDLLFLGFFLCSLMEKKGITPTEIIQDTITKYKLKHPHVFRSRKFRNTEEIVKFWHSSKKDIFEGIPESLPALMAAKLIQERAARVGFDWADAQGPLQKLVEEIKELEKAGSRRERVDELGDLLFSCVNLARHLKIDPEDALRKANRKFVNRFRTMQRKLIKTRLASSSVTLEEMDKIWNEVKNSKR